MIKSLKITDGDLLMINLGSSMSQTQAHIEKYAEHIRKWLNSKDLKNVTLQVSAGYTEEFTIVHYTVNDVFEQAVLKGDSNG